MKAAGKGMKSKKALKAAICLVCSLLLAMSLNPAFAIASTENNSYDGALANDATQSLSTDSVQAESQASENRVFIDGDKVVTIEEVDLAGTRSSKGMSLLSSNPTGVGLKDTNEVKWFDRIAFPEEYESTFKEFYELLEESCDNDGVLDFLIEDQYVDPDSNAHSVTGKYRKLKTDDLLSYYDCTALEPGVFSFTHDSEDDPDLEIKSAIFNQCLKETIAAFDRDHPEVFWLGSSTYIMTQAPNIFSEDTQNASGQYTAWVYLLIGGYKSFGIQGSEDIRSADFKSEEDIKGAIETREKQVQAILADVGVSYLGNGVDLEPYEGVKDVQYTDSGVVRIFNNKLTHTNSYNSSNLNTLMSNYPSAFECISALEGGIGKKGPVCEGYARAFKVLCDAVGINCVLTDGDGNGEAHMWNYVEIGSIWYAVDVTWNDPGKQQAQESGLEHEGYLLVGANTICGSTSQSSTFIDSHVVENVHFNNGLQFLNGPVLSDTAFAFDTKGPLAVSTGSSLSSAQISGLENKVFNKQPVIQSNFKVSLNDENLQSGSDYVYDCVNNMNPGQAELRIYGRGNYFGSSFTPFTIYKATVEAKSVSIPNVTYDGSEQKPEPIVVLTNSRLKEGEDYSVTTTYTNNVNAGTANARVAIRGINSCEGEVVKDLTFTINPLDIGGATVSTNDMVYTGGLLTPKVTVKMNDPSLIEGTHYSTSIAYSNNKNVGNAAALVTIKGIGNYGGTVKCTANFKISPKKMKISKLVSKKKSFVARWAKGTKAWCTGYQIRYSTNSKLKSGVKTTTVKKYSTAQTTIKKLKSKKNYYVQIRAYKTIGGAKYYGEWSAAKKVRTK